MNMARNLCGVIFLSCTLFSCSLFTKKDQIKDGPAQGEISIAVDESFQLLLESEKTAFENNYHFAHIILKFTPENEAVADLLNEKVRSIVISRELTTIEKKIFTREKITYRSFPFAADGIALLTNKQNTDTLISLPLLKDLLLGKISNWNKMGAHSVSGEILVVVDQANSSNIKFLIDKLIEAGGTLTKNLVVCAFANFLKGLISSNTHKLLPNVAIAKSASLS